MGREEIISARKLFLKRTEVANTHIVSLIADCLTVVPYLRQSRFGRTGVFTFLLLVEKTFHWSAWRPLDGVLSISWLPKRRHVLWLFHLQIFMDGEPVCFSFARHAFLQQISLTELWCWVKKSPRISNWHLEYWHAFNGLHQSSHMIGGSSTVAIYRNPPLGRSDDVLGEILGIDKDEPASLFRRTFGAGTTTDNFQKPLAKRCYQGALSVRDKHCQFEIWPDYPWLYKFSTSGKSTLNSPGKMWNLQIM